MSTFRTCLTTAVLAAASVGFVGCSPDTEAGSSNRGSGNSAGETSVENAYIVPTYLASCVLQLEGPAYLMFTATNSSGTEDERLVDISTPIAESVTISARPEMLTFGPDTSIAAGQPVENEDPAAADRPFPVLMQGLDPTVEPGKSFPVTFDFERAGDITVDTAVEACPVESF